MRNEEYCVAFCALARMKAEPNPPITIVSLSRIEYASRPIEISRVGSNTMPSVTERDFSGLRSGLPPMTVGNWLLQSAGLPVAVFGQRIGSRVAFAVTLADCGLYRSVSDGARKPEPIEARSSSCVVGWNRNDSFGLVVEPTDW